MRYLIDDPGRKRHNRLSLQPRHRRISPTTLLVAALVVVGGGWMAYRTYANGPDLRAELLDVSGYTDNVPVWMPFKLQLRLHNDGNESITIRRIDVEPDLDEFNEAFSAGAPYDLSPPILLEPGTERPHELSVTILNANQLPERTYSLVFIVRMQTDAGEIVTRFPMQLRYFRDPARRLLERGA
jgi:hypothetical protein